MSDATNTTSQPKPESGSDKPAASPGKSNIIVFLCPSCKAKVNAPGNMQGKPAKCPHCDTKFLIPLDSKSAASDSGATKAGADSAPSSAGPAEIGLDEHDDSQGSRILSDSSLGGELDSLGEELDDLEEIEEIEELEEIVEEPVEELPSSPYDSFLPPVDDTDEESHPLAALFAALWQEREHGGIVELHMGDGVTIVPDWWAERLSRGTHRCLCFADFRRKLRDRNRRLGCRETNFGAQNYRTSRRDVSVRDLQERSTQSLASRAR